MNTSSERSDKSSGDNLRRFDHNNLTDMAIALNLLENMNMPQFPDSHDMKPGVSESFLKHVEEIAELLENPYAKSLLKQAIKQI